jgi:hypothetical protein
MEVNHMKKMRHHLFSGPERQDASRTIAAPSPATHTLEEYTMQPGAVHIVISAQNRQTTVLKWQEQKNSRNILPSLQLPNMINIQLEKFIGCEDVRMHIITPPNADVNATAELKAFVENSIASSQKTATSFNYHRDYFEASIFIPSKIPHDQFESYRLEGNTPKTTQASSTEAAPPTWLKK